MSEKILMTKVEAQPPIGSWASRTQREGPGCGPQLSIPHAVVCLVTSRHVYIAAESNGQARSEQGR